MKVTQDLKDELYKTKEIMKAKTQLYEVQNNEMEVFELQQEIEKLKHENLLRSNENALMRNEIEKWKMKATQNKLSYEAKDRAYNELSLQSKGFKLICSH